MSDMGIFRTRIATENPLNRGTLREVRDVMVDTGSEYTWVPRGELDNALVSREAVEQPRPARGDEVCLTAAA